MSQEKTERNKLMLHLRAKGLPFRQIFEQLMKEERGYSFGLFL